MGRSADHFEAPLQTQCKKMFILIIRNVGRLPQLSEGHFSGVCIAPVLHRTYSYSPSTFILAVVNLLDRSFSQSGVEHMVVNIRPFVATTRFQRLPQEYAMKRVSVSTFAVCTVYTHVFNNILKKVRGLQGQIQKKIKGGAKSIEHEGKIWGYAHFR